MFRVMITIVMAYRVKICKFIFTKLLAQKKLKCKNPEMSYRCYALTFRRSESRPTAFLPGMVKCSPLKSLFSDEFPRTITLF